MKYLTIFFLENTNFHRMQACTVYKPIPNVVLILTQMMMMAQTW